MQQALQRRNADTSAASWSKINVVTYYEPLVVLTRLKWKETIIARDGDKLVRLDDIARIDLNHFETNSESWFKDEQVLSLQVKRESGSNVIDIKYAMLAEVERINEELLKPAGCKSCSIPMTCVTLKRPFRTCCLTSRWVRRLPP